MKRTKAHIKKDIFNFIQSNSILSLATQSEKGPWICTLHYGHDKNFNLYILTDPNSIHGKHFQKNNKIAFSIFDSHQKITKPKIGLQGTGKIRIITGKVSISKALILWVKANPGIEEKINLKDIMKKITNTKIYQITPTYLKLLNKQLFYPNEYGILNL